MKALENRSDIEMLINSFYERVRADERIGFIFNEVIGDDWGHHLPIMYQFWEMVLLNQQGYKGNPIMKHVELDKKILLTQAHFDRWLELWNATIADLYSGEKAEEAKNRAMLMANLIHMKVQMARGGKMIQ